ncbi:molybdenum cofactor guanylyltransferase [Candidatus Bathyarchaeota archaeon]|nr:molybdenum cofactor guanylyltransferase [Candidatus Bathyarchaeota archaeon]
MQQTSLKKSAVILAGGFSKRFGREKGLTELFGKPLIDYVLGKVSGVVDEKVLVVSSEVQKYRFVAVTRKKVNVVVDELEIQSPLIGALTGFKHVHGDYSVLLSCDTPFLSSQIISVLLDLCINRHAVVPQWPNGYLEPLQAAYHTKSALTAAETAAKCGKLDLRSMISRLGKVKYVSTLILRQLDPKLLTFFNVNTPEDLREAESILE